MLRRCFGDVSGMLRSCFGDDSGMFRGCFGDASGLFRGCFGVRGGSHSNLRTSAAVRRFRPPWSCCCTSCMRRTPSPSPGQTVMCRKLCDMWASCPMRLAFLHLHPHPRLLARAHDRDFESSYAIPNGLSRDAQTECAV